MAKYMDHTNTGWTPDLQALVGKVGGQANMNQFVNQYEGNPGSFAGYSAANPNWKYSTGGNWTDLQKAGGGYSGVTGQPMIPGQGSNPYQGQTPIGTPSNPQGGFTPTGPGYTYQNKAIGSTPINTNNGQGFNSYSINPNQFKLGS
jgi:hypothetical protein